MERPDISVGEILSRALALYRTYFRVLIPIALAIFVIVSVLGEVLGREPWAFVVSQAVSLAATFLFQGIVVGLVRDDRAGDREPSVAGLVAAVGPALGSLVGAGILYGMGIGIGLFLLIVPGLVLLTVWAVVAPVIVIERKEMLDAFGRSRELVRGHGWPVFGTLVVVNLILVVATFAFVAVAASIADGLLLQVIFAVIGSTLAAPIVALATAILYFELVELKGRAPATRFTGF